MTSLAEAKRDLQANYEFTMLVDTLKGIAASQFQALLRAKKRFEKFVAAFDSFFQMTHLLQMESPLIQVSSDITGMVMVTSDEGFMGGLNKKIIESALEFLGKEKTKLVCIGGRGSDYIKSLRFDCVSFPGIIHETRYEQAIKISDFLVKEVLEKKMGKVFLCYPNPVSFTVQRPEIIPLLPCSELFQKKEKGLDEERRVMVESSFQGIVEYLAGMWITYRLYDIFEDSKLSEFAARTMRLEQSHDTLTRQGKMLRHRYHRCRRELVDKGLRETFASALLRDK